jgi:hypothetical protein
MRKPGVYLQRHPRGRTEAGAHRTRLLAKLEAKIRNDLRRDLTAYRHRVRELRDVRAHGGDIHREPCCEDIYVDVSLTFAHVYGGLANLETIKQLGSRQLDLFGML